MANRQIKAELEVKGKDSTSAAFRSVALRMGQMERQFAAFNRTAAQVDKRMRQVERSASAFSRMQGAAANMKNMLVTGVAGYGIYQAAAGAKRAIVDFAAFERHMNRIGITADATKEEIGGATNEIMNLTKSMSYGSFDPAISALDTLVASGMSLKEAMAFLPSVMMTAQATGSETADIANTAMKASSALQIQAGEMQKAFDIMVTGSKAGQFEMKDMAAYIPDLANMFASLGYSGTDGLKQLVAVLQTIREDTGNASDAATYARNVFQKMYAPETATKFKKFGIDLYKSMDKAKENGEDALSAFVRLSKEAVHGDMSKLPRLFTDAQFLLGMQSLMTSPESLKKFADAMNGTNVNGTVFRDLNRVMSDTQAKIDRLSSSWSRFVMSTGGALSDPAGGTLDTASNLMDKRQWLHNSFAAEGKGRLQELGWMARNAPFPWSDSEALNRRLYIGGGRGNADFTRHYLEQAYGNAAYRPAVGGSVSFGSGGDGRQHYGIGTYQGRPIPIPISASEVPVAAATASAVDIAAAYQQYGASRRLGEAYAPKPWKGLRNAMGMDLHAAYPSGNAPGISISMDDLRRTFALDSGQRGSQRAIINTLPDGSFNAFSGFESILEQAGKKSGNAMAEEMDARAKMLGVTIGAATAEAIRNGLSGFQIQANGNWRPVNANTGQSMPPSARSPATFGPR